VGGRDSPSIGRENPTWHLQRFNLRVREDEIEQEIDRRKKSVGRQYNYQPEDEWKVGRMEEWKDGRQPELHSHGAPKLVG
jgi:hypothetical protein